MPGEDVRRGEAGHSESILERIKLTDVHGRFRVSSGVGSLNKSDGKEN